MHCTVLKNARLLGETNTTDIFLAGGVIAMIAPAINPGNLACTTVDLEGRTVIPGLVDGHVHYLGTAGDEGLDSKTPEIFVSHFFKHGVTTAVGVLGFGSVVEGPRHLYAKTNTLYEDGLSAYMHTGTFDIPSPTVTGSVKEDLVMLPRVLGVKVAVNDPCASLPSVREFARLAGLAYIAGNQSGKCGVLHTHIGHHGDPYAFLEEAHLLSGVPKKQFVPTHCNWSTSHVDGAIPYAKNGGFVDFSTILSWERGSMTSMAASDATVKLLDAGVPETQISFSSDGNVGMSIRDKDRTKYGLYLQRVNSLYEEVVALAGKGVSYAAAVKLATENPARYLGLYPKKGTVAVGSDADIVAVNDDLSIHAVYARGREAVRAGEPLIFSRFEREQETYVAQQEYKG